MNTHHIRSLERAVIRSFEKPRFRRDLALRELDRDLSVPRPFIDSRTNTSHRLLSVSAFVPRSMVSQTRREIYPYPHPLALQKRGRAIRIPMALRNEPYVKTRVRIRLPKRLPLVRGSYVSITPERLTIHSRNQLHRAIASGERNRHRYVERKTNHRFGRHGQLESRGSAAYGLVAFAARKGWSANRIADQALVARAILRGR